MTITVNPSAAKQFTIRVRAPQRDVSSLYTSRPAADGITSINVNGSRVTPSIVNGYAVIARTWKAGDRIDIDLPDGRAARAWEREDCRNCREGRLAVWAARVQRRTGRSGHQRRAQPSTRLTPEWRKDLLGGVTVIKGAFADGTALTAIPNFTRYNRTPPSPPQPPLPAGAPRPAPPPPTSIVWIRKA